MKNLITSIACIGILLAFVLQFAQNQVIYNHMIGIDQAVNNFKEIAKQEGCITSLNSNSLKKEISAIVDCTTAEVNITGTVEPVDRGQIIHYIIEAPIRGIISAASFWGIKSKANRFTYKIDRYTTSEHLG